MSTSANRSLVADILRRQGFQQREIDAIEALGTNAESLQFMEKLSPADFALAVKASESDIDPLYKDKLHNALAILKFLDQPKEESVVGTKNESEFDPLYKYIKRVNNDHLPPKPAQIPTVPEEKPLVLPTFLEIEVIDGGPNLFDDISNKSEVKLLEVLEGKLWKKTQSRLEPWVLRDFKAESAHGSISYKRKLGSSKSFWLVDGCEIHMLAGLSLGRPNCLRIRWPSGHDLFLAAETEVGCIKWFEFLEAMLFPPLEIQRSRLEVLGNSSTQALIRASIRSHRWKARTVSDRHELQFKAKASPKYFTAEKLEGADDSEESMISMRENQLNQSFHGSSRVSSTALEAALQGAQWALGNPHPRYDDSPEFAHSYLPVERRMQWVKMCIAFPARHQEELRRFLVANDFNVERASSSLLAHISWRAQNLPVQPLTCAAELKKGKCFVKGVDFHGNPVIYYLMRKQDRHSRNLRDNFRMVVYRTEQALAWLPMRDGKVTLVLALDGMQDGNWDEELLREWMRLFATHYPERLFNALVCPTDSALRIKWALAGISNDPKVNSKVKFLGAKSELLHYISSENLIDSLGGHLIFSIDEEAGIQRAAPSRRGAGGSAEQVYGGYESAHPSSGDGSEDLAAQIAAFADKGGANAEESNEDDAKNRVGISPRNAAASSSADCSSARGRIETTSDIIPIMLPRLWTSDASVDYYPPPVSFDSSNWNSAGEKLLSTSSMSRSRGTTDAMTRDDGVEGENDELLFMCDECEFARCKACFLARGSGSLLLDGWRPLNIDELYPPLVPLQ